MGATNYKTNPNIPFGSQIVTINGVAYNSENITPKSPTTKVTREDTQGLPNGFVMINGRKTITLKLQIATTTTPVPTRGMTFVYTARGDTATTYAIDDVTQPTSNKTIESFDLAATEAK